MSDVNEVYAALMAYCDVSSYTAEQLLPSCEKGLNWVQSRLRDNVAPDDPLITQTAAALSHFYFFLYRLTEPDKYENCKVGDTSYKRNIQKELEFERQIKDQAIADAAAILKDGGFYCHGG